MAVPSTDRDQKDIAGAGSCINGQHFKIGIFSNKNAGPASLKIAVEGVGPGQDSHTALSVASASQRASPVQVSLPLGLGVCLPGPEAL